jgi:mannose-6-phosphate isomerase
LLEKMNIQKNDLQGSSLQKTFGTQFLIPLLPNRVRRNYKGGSGIDRLQNKKADNTHLDGEKPEEWIASLVSAVNPGLEPRENEGLSRCAAAGEPLLIDVIKSAPLFYLGIEHFRKHGFNTGFLFKILDSSMRLHVQAHPTAAFARENLGSQYGKFECYYILAVREGTTGYIRLGFQHLPAKEEWRRIITEQDIPAMDACFEKIPVSPGEVWYIPGAVAHAIGENILMLEIMEPSDLVVRCEFERDGIVVPPEARFMGRDIDFCLDVFDYTEQSPVEVTKKYRLLPLVLPESCRGALFEELAAPPVAPFVVRRLSLEAGAEFSFPNTACAAALVTRGNAIVKAGGMSTALEQGRSIFIAAAAEHITVCAPKKTEICFVWGR